MTEKSQDGVKKIRMTEKNQDDRKKPGCHKKDQVAIEKRQEDMKKDAVLPLLFAE